MSRSTFLCPCCGKPMAGGAPRDILEYGRLSPSQRELIEVFVNAYPRGLTINQVVDIRWQADPNGGPDDGVRLVRVHINHINKRIAEHGWRIEQRGSGYRLYPIEGAEK